MQKNKLIPFILALTGLIWLAAALPAFASAPEQGVPYSTPTPGPDGRILYKVQKGDTCLRIKLLTNISTDELIKLNNLDKDCTIREGQELLLGKVTMATAAPQGPTPTPTIPGPTPLPGSGQVCIYLFLDVNGDSVHQEMEPTIAGGAISLTDRSGLNSLTQTTTAGVNPACFEKVPEGDYNVSVAIPDGYNPTTSLNYALPVRAGDRAILDFGAQLNSQSAPVAEVTTRRSPLLGILGGALLLGGIGLGIYVKWGPRPSGHP